MPNQLTIQAREALARALTEAHMTTQDFDNLMHHCWGFRAYGDVPLFGRASLIDIANAVLEKADLEGHLDKFLFLCVNKDPNLEAAVRQWHAPALERLQQVSVYIDRADSELGTAISNYEVRKAVTDTSSRQVRSVIVQIDRLTRFKRLHDVVHRVLLQPLRTTNELIGRITTDDTAVESLETYLATVAASVASAEQIIMGISNAFEAEREAAWVRALSAETDAFVAVLRARKSRGAGIRAIKMNTIAETHAKRLNDEIVAAARSLPLEGMVEALDNLARADQDRFEALRPVAIHLNTLQGYLLARAAVHNRLQEMQEELAALAERLTAPDSDVIVDFNDVWTPALKEVSDIMSLRPDPGFPERPKGFDSSARAVADSLLGVDQAENAVVRPPTVAAQPQAPNSTARRIIRILRLVLFGANRGRHDQVRALRRADETARVHRVAALSRAFHGFRQMLTLHFYVVDKNLLNDLERLSRLSNTLQPILAGMPVDGRNP